MVAAAGLGIVVMSDAGASCGTDGGVMTEQETVSLLSAPSMAPQTWLVWATSGWRDAIVEMVFSMLV